MEIIVSIQSFICLFICIMYTIEVHKTLVLITKLSLKENKKG